MDYVKIMTASLSHKTGCSWFITTNYWPKVIILTLASQEESEIAKEGYSFISKLIEKSFAINKEFCSTVIHALVSPIIDLKKAVQLEENTDGLSYHQSITPSLNVLKSSMVTLLYTKNADLFKHFADVANQNEFEKYALEICEEMIEENSLFASITTLYLLYFFQMLHKVSKVSILRSDDISSLLTKYDTLRRNILLKKPISIYMRLMYSGLRYKHIVHGMFPKIITKNRIVVSCREQMIYHQLFPCLFLSLKLFGMEYAFFESTDRIREHVIQKHVDRIIPVVFNQLFQLKETLEDTGSFEEGSLALGYLLKSTSFYHRDEANTIVDLLMFCYEDLSGLVAEDWAQGVVVVPEKLNYLARMIETITTLICQFDLNWRDALETFVLMEITGDVLCLSGLTEQVS